MVVLFIDVENIRGENKVEWKVRFFFSCMEFDKV